MAKVLSVHMLALREGVQEDDFERFVKDEWYPHFVSPPGHTGRLLKGVKGDRQGKYLWIWESESEEAAKRADSESLWLKPPGNKDMIEKWHEFDKGFAVIFNNYAVIE